MFENINLITEHNSQSDTHLNGSSIALVLLTKFQFLATKFLHCYQRTLLKISPLTAIRAIAL